MTINTLGPLSTFQKNIKNWLFVRRIITNSAVTLPHSKHTSGSHLHITGQEYIQTEHTKTYLTCQRWKSSMDKPLPLHPLPIPDQPNIRIHADLFGPMLAAGCQHKYILCITDAFTKYALVTAIKNKEAETVAKAIFFQLVL
jgi:hypothetical protein